MITYMEEKFDKISLSTNFSKSPCYYLRRTPSITKKIKMVNSVQQDEQVV